LVSQILKNYDSDEEQENREEGCKVIHNYDELTDLKATAHNTSETENCIRHKMRDPSKIIEATSSGTFFDDIKSIIMLRTKLFKI
jgi:hypothetical protein